MTTKKEDCRHIEWPGDIDLHSVSLSTEDTSPTRCTEPRVRIWLLGVFAGLLVALTVWAMVNGNQTILDKTFELIRYGLSAGVGFEVGRAKRGPG